jgi:hypothetical protein
MGIKQLLFELIYKRILHGLDNPVTMYNKCVIKKARKTTNAVKANKIRLTVPI